MRRLTVVLLAPLLGVIACEQRRLTEADCTAVRSRLEAAWLADANEAVTMAETDQFRRFVKDESKRIGERWMAQCRQRLDRDIDEAELNCLLKADRIDDVARCVPAD